MGVPRVPLAAAIAGALVYAVSLGGQFVLDDHTAIEASSCVTESLELAKIFGRNFWCQAPGAETIDSYRPLPVLAWWGAWQLGGGAAWPFHLLNVLLHAVVCGLVARLGQLWFSDEDGDRAGLWAGLAFAALPIHAEAVGSVVGVAELWAAAFGVLAIVMAAGASASNHRVLANSGLCVLALLAALLSKESAVVYPVVVVLVVWSGQAERRDKVLVTLAVVAVLAGYLVLRAKILGAWLGTHVTPTVNPLVESPGSERWAMAPALLGRYLALSFAGYPMSADYGFQQIPIEPVSSYAVLGVAGMVGMGGLAWRRRSRHGYVLCVAWAAGAVALALNVVAALPAMFAERLFYGPSIPVCLLLGVGASMLIANRGRRGVVLAGLVVVMWAVAAAQHAYRWTTEERITEVTAEHSPRSARAHVWRARVLGRAGDFEKMREHAETAVEILPSWANARALLAASMDGTGEPEKAVQMFRSAADLDAADPEVADLFIQFLLRYGHTEPARLVYARHVRANGGAAAPSVTRP